MRYTGVAIVAFILSLCGFESQGIQSIPLREVLSHRRHGFVDGSQAARAGTCSDSEVTLRVAKSVEHCAAKVASSRKCASKFYYCLHSSQCVCQAVDSATWNCSAMNATCVSAALTDARLPHQTNVMFQADAAQQLQAGRQRGHEIRPQVQRDSSHAEGAKPHILMIILDDLGFAEVGFNRQHNMTGIPTPNIDVLAEAGLILERHYVHKLCSPTRSAIQSGRAPIRVNVQNLGAYARNPSDNVSGFAGIPTKMTGIAEVLKAAGYRTHMVGKWDVGSTVPEQLPQGKGYDTSLIYTQHENDCWTHVSRIGGCGTKVDLWEHDETTPFPGQPALRFANSEGCTFKTQNATGVCVYEDALFEERVKQIITDHDAAIPLFLVWATHAVHGPYQPPADYRSIAQEMHGQLGDPSFEQWASNKDKYHGSLIFIDEAIGRVIQLLRSKDLYKDTIIVFTSDNGGVMGFDNRPLKGSKFSNWEGGIRACAFVAGGFLPDRIRGTRTSGLIAAWDWYATFAYLAGVGAEDARAAAAGLPPVESINMWPLLSGASRLSPRQAVEIGSTLDDLETLVGSAVGAHGGKGTPMIGGLIREMDGKLYKVLVGDITGSVVGCATYSGPGFPSADGKACGVFTVQCGITPNDGCLFDLSADPGESRNLAASEPRLFAAMLAELHGNFLYKPDRGSTEVAMDLCNSLAAKFAGYLGPHVEFEHAAAVV